MDINKIIIVDIPFNCKKHPFWSDFEKVYEKHHILAQSKEWIDYRIDILIKYTLKSLKKQINQKFYCIVRYEKTSEKLIFDALSKYETLPSNIIFTYEGDNLIEGYIKDYDYLYHVRIDSDNMYYPEFIQKINDIEYLDGLECILCTNGYMFDESSKRVASMYHKSPSFYTLIYKTKEYMDGYRIRFTSDHGGAYLLNNIKITDYSFMIIVHGNNLANNFDVIMRAFKCTQLDDKMSQEILKKWDII